MALFGIPTAAIGPAFNVGSQIFGSIFGGRGRTNPLASANQSALLQLLQRALDDDPSLRIQEAQEAGLKFARTVGTQSVDSALADIAAGGGKINLPSTQRAGIISSAIQPTMQNLALQTAQQQLGAFDQWLNNVLSVTSQISQGRGNAIPRTGGSQLNPATLASSVNDLLKTLE